jgi:D-arabinose 1-dehydrogenase-like Zn-dependent alcohol dehydrogenase
VGSKNDTQEMFDFSAKHGIRCMVETFDFEDFPKALDMLENGRPKFRCVVNVGDYAKKHCL